MGSNAAFKDLIILSIDLSKATASWPCFTNSAVLSFSIFNCLGPILANLSWLDNAPPNLSIDIPVASENACWAKTLPFKAAAFSFINLSSSAACVASSPVNAAYLNLSKFKSFCKNISASISLAIELSKSKWDSAAAAISSIDIPNLAAVWAALTNPSTPPLTLNLTFPLDWVIASITAPISEDVFDALSNSLTVPAILS